MHRYKNKWYRVGSPVSIRPGKWVDSPHLIAINIIINEAFFDNFLVIIYLLVVYKNNNNIKIYDKQQS